MLGGVLRAHHCGFREGEVEVVRFHGLVVSTTARLLPDRHSVFLLSHLLQALLQAFSMVFHARCAALSETEGASKLCSGREVLGLLHADGLAGWERIKQRLRVCIIVYLLAFEQE